MELTWSFFKYFNKKYEEAEKKLGGNPTKEQLKTLPERSGFISRRINLSFFSRAISRFALYYCNDPDEMDLHFNFSIPWIFSFEFTLDLDSKYYKQKYPFLHKTGLQYNSGFIINGDYCRFMLDYYYDPVGLNETRHGFNYCKFYSDIINKLKGKTNETKTSELTYCNIFNKTLSTYYKPEWYINNHIPVVVEHSGLTIVRLAVWVYEEKMEVINKRWFNKVFTRYYVYMANRVIVPGKGENSWDQDDEIYGGISENNLGKYGHELFSTGCAKSPEEAAQRYIESIKRALNRN